MGRIRREIAVLTPSQAKAFAKLALVVTDRLGVVAGIAALGINTTTYYALINRSFITDKQAATLMTGYKKFKASQSIAA